MKPYYEHGGVTIYHGDCREVLAALPHAAVSLVVSDPPYGVEYSTGHRHGVVRSSTRLRGDRDEDSSLLGEVVGPIGEHLRPAAALYLFAAPERLDSVLPVLRTQWEVVNILVWDKGNCTAGDLETRYGEQWEAIVYARTARVPLMGRRDRDVLRFSRGSTGDYLHPTQKPLALKRFLIAKHPDGPVLDPFMGSGTTLVAAKDLGRRAIGIEIEERYCEVAARRLSQEVLPGLAVSP